MGCAVRTRGLLGFRKGNKRAAGGNRGCCWRACAADSDAAWGDAQSESFYGGGHRSIRSGAAAVARLVKLVWPVLAYVS